MASRSSRAVPGAQTDLPISDLADASNRIDAAIEALREDLARLGAAARQAQTQLGLAAARIAATARGLPAVASPLTRQTTIEVGFASSIDERTAAGSEREAEAARGRPEIFAAAERLKLQAAKGNADEVLRIYDEWLAETATVYSRDSTQYLNLEREKVAAAQQASAARLRAAEEEQRQEQETYRKAAEEATKQWQGATRQISDQMGSLVADVLDGTKTVGQGFREIVDSLLGDFTKSAFASLLGGSGGGVSSLLFGSQGLSGLLGLGSGGLFGLLGNALGLGEATLAAADVAAMWGGGGEADVLAGLGTAGSPSGSGGLLGWVGGLLGLDHGAIVPSAAAGWVVPHFAKGGILSVLHQREMVLPANISDGLQSLITTGGGGHVFNLNISALDGKSVMDMGPRLVASLNRAMRNGATLRQPS